MYTESYEFQGQQFEWDTAKGMRNIEKHGIPFKEAATVFRDSLAVVLDDERHSQLEDRFIIIGRSKKTRLLYTCYCYRASDTIIRIISARNATESETKLYGGEE